MVHPFERRPGCGLSSARSVRRPRFSDTAKAVSLERRSIRAASSGSEVVYSRPCEAPVSFHRSKGFGATLPAAAVAAWSYPARQSPDVAARRVPEGDEAGRRIGDLGRRGAARIDGLTAGDGGAPVGERRRRWNRRRRSALRFVSAASIPVLRLLRCRVGRPVTRSQRLRVSVEGSGRELRSSVAKRRGGVYKRRLVPPP